MWNKTKWPQVQKLHLPRETWSCCQLFLSIFLYIHSLFINENYLKQVIKYRIKFVNKFKLKKNNINRVFMWFLNLQKLSYRKYMDDPFCLKKLLSIRLISKRQFALQVLSQTQVANTGRNYAKDYKIFA